MAGLVWGSCFFAPTWVEVQSREQDVSLGLSMKPACLQWSLPHRHTAIFTLPFLPPCLLSFILFSLLHLPAFLLCLCLSQFICGSFRHLLGSESVVEVCQSKANKIELQRSWISLHRAGWAKFPQSGITCFFFFFFFLVISFCNIPI